MNTVQKHFKNVFYSYNSVSVTPIQCPLQNYTWNSEKEPGSEVLSLCGLVDL